MSESTVLVPSADRVTSRTAGQAAVDGGPPSHCSNDRPGAETGNALS